MRKYFFTDRNSCALTCFYQMVLSLLSISISHLSCPCAHKCLHLLALFCSFDIQSSHLLQHNAAASQNWEVNAVNWNLKFCRNHAYDISSHICCLCCMMILPLQVVNQLPAAAPLLVKTQECLSGDFLKTLPCSGKIQVRPHPPVFSVAML